VPCIVHLRCEHFVLLREQRDAFLNVIDPVADGPRWLTRDDLLEEATGCVIVSDAVPTTPGVSLVAIDAPTAATYRGRCHNPLAADHDDSPPCTTCPCPPGVSPAAVGAGHSGGGSPAAGPGRPGAGGAGGGSSAEGGSGRYNPYGITTTPGQPATSCSSCGQGMATYFVSEP
jgi:hypothetical protein